ncbi:MAG: hypothetical protein K8U57_13985 [Planctomycetes bacterium]|nr:hypothetical protein [Planctomycetota bacterium]
MARLVQSREPSKDGQHHQEVMMNVPQTTPRLTTRRKTQHPPKRPVTEMLLEITYLLHATKVVKRLAAPSREPRS